jgi:putative ABC transport system substrate-binding protein
MLRRHLLAALPANIGLLALRAGAQERVRRIGVLAGNEPLAAGKKAWLEGLRERGWVEGRNLQIDYRFFEGRYEQVPALASELAAFAPEVIVAAGADAAVAVRAAAPTTPMIFLFVVDPVGQRLVESVAHPRGNATGFALLVPEGFRGKAFQLFKETVPRASHIAFLTNPLNRTLERYRSNDAEIERQLGFKLVNVEASVLTSSNPRSRPRARLVPKPSWSPGNRFT